MNSKKIKKMASTSKLNSPFLLQQLKSYYKFKPYSLSINPNAIFNIFILQSIYSHSLITEDIEIFDDINDSIASNKNFIKDKIQNYHNAINWLGNNSLQTKGALIKILNFISPELKTKGFRKNNSQVQTFYKSNQKYWYFADPKEVEFLMDNYTGSIKKLDDENVLPFIYPQLILIHPFKNGNGRLSRFLQIYCSYKLYQKTELLFPMAYFYRNVPENREFEHKKIKNYCLTNEVKSIQLWFDDFLEYGKNQLQYIEAEILKHHELIEHEYGKNAIPKNMLFQVNIDLTNVELNQLRILEKLAKKHYFIRIDNQFLNLFLCTIISLLKKNRKEFNST